MKELISVIVPIYNVEKYLKKCIESIINQTYHNLEIILVDDGSPDNSGKIADEYAEKDERIKVIHKTNGGISDARNEGIKVSKGEFIIFVDSDDMLNESACEVLHRLAIKNDVDIVFAQNIKTYENEQGEIIIPNFEDKPEEKILTHNEALRLMLLDGEVGNYAHTKLFKRDLFDGILFPVGKVYEDAATIYKLVHKANKIAHTTQKVYYYLYGRAGAITSSFSEKKILDSLEAYNGQYKFLKENYKEIKDAVNITWAKMYTSAMEKICMNDYEELWISQGVLDKYDDFKDAVDELTPKTLNQYLEPYRVISIVLLRHNRETYKMLFKTIFENLKNR